jgi:hypothetical protein
MALIFHLSRRFHPAEPLDITKWNAQSHLIYLLDKPLYLAFRPFFLVKWVYRHHFAAMLDAIVRFSTDDTKRLSTAPILVDNAASTDRLNPVHDHALNNCELSVAFSVQTLIASSALLTVVLRVRLPFPAHSDR